MVVGVDLASAGDAMLIDATLKAVTNAKVLSTARSHWTSSPSASHSCSAQK
jgi:hypothetical protein